MKRVPTTGNDVPVHRAILKAYRHLLREPERDRLLAGLCDILVQDGVFGNAWVFLLDENGRAVLEAASGDGIPQELIGAAFEEGTVPGCAAEALKAPGPFVFYASQEACGSCPFPEACAGGFVLCSRFESEGHVSGALCVTMGDAGAREQILTLVGQLARDVGGCLTQQEPEKGWQETKAALEESRYKLGERVKELNCLYAISRIFEKRNTSMEDILRGTVALIPPAWQYPEITCARIVYEGDSYTTPGFRETTWRQASEIVAYGKPCGLLEVFYSEARPDSDEGPFLAEERSLMETITERLGRIAERMQAQSELREREKSFRDLVENSPVGIVIVQDGKIVYLNPEQKRLTGSLLRLYEPLVLDAVHPEDAGRVRTNLEKITADERRRVEMDFRFLREEAGSAEDATWVSCRASRIAYHGREAVFITMMDVTKAKRIELLLRIQDKMASLGHVAAGIAHEIRNPLSGINIYLNALEQLTGDGEASGKVREILRQMHAASEKIESVIRRVMDFSRPSEPRLTTTNINDPVDEAAKLSSVTLRKVGIRLEKDLAGDLPACHADPQMIEQVVLNMITNAAEAMKSVSGEKRLRLSTRLEGERLSIEVADSGPGVPPHLKDKIFDPFYTTKSGSTGIGLSLSHRMIADHGGTLELATSEWDGALFIIRLPVSRKGP